MKTMIYSLPGVTLGVATMATFINVEAAFAVLAAVGVLLIAVKDYSAGRVTSSLAV